MDEKDISTLIGMAEASREPMHRALNKPYVREGLLDVLQQLEKVDRASAFIVERCRNIYMMLSFPAGRALQEIKHFLHYELEQPKDIIEFWVEKYVPSVVPMTPVSEEDFLPYSESCYLKRPNISKDLWDSTVRRVLKKNIIRVKQQFQHNCDQILNKLNSIYEWGAELVRYAEKYLFDKMDKLNEESNNVPDLEATKYTSLHYCRADVNRTMAKVYAKQIRRVRDVASIARTLLLSAIFRFTKGDQIRFTTREMAKERKEKKEVMLENVKKYQQGVLAATIDTKS